MAVVIAAVVTCHGVQASREAMTRNRAALFQVRTSDAEEEERVGFDKSEGRERYKYCLRQCGKLYNADRSQYVKRRQEVGGGQGNLLYSAKFKEGGVMWKLHGEAGLLTSSNEYVAQVTVRQLEELDLATSFNSAKGVLRKNLKVTKVLLDELLIDVVKVKQSYDEYLKGVFANTIDNVQNAEDLFQLENILKFTNQDSQKMLTSIKKNTFMAEQTKQVLMRCFEMESRQTTRNRVFNVINSFLGGSTRSCVDILRGNIRFGIESHKAKVLEIAPGIMRKHLTVLQDSNVLFVTRYDLKLFSDMINAMDNTLVKTMIHALVDRYFQRIKQTSTNQLQAVLPLTNQIFFYLCKSVLEYFVLRTDNGLETDHINHSKIVIVGQMP
ncbi:conserved hypothetical protein [Culex quinquefasciatus]|uniref:Uncharacterized protein n=1 Tax=Culex quinquefasciatus TaxID=7176 RepID=B0XLE6_CULQU|nr:conserved hypothetical protein [Culex quinquefasciatus]|eukprot:XP_001870468.1 conserved hypothetical protein [Culex quinquefasciatus]